MFHVTRRAVRLALVLFVGLSCASGVSPPAPLSPPPSPPSPLPPPPPSPPYVTSEATTFYFTLSGCPSSLRFLCGDYFLVIAGGLRTSCGIDVDVLLNSASSASATVVLAPHAASNDFYISQIPSLAACQNAAYCYAPGNTVVLGSVILEAATLSSVPPSSWLCAVNGTTFVPTPLVFTFPPPPPAPPPPPPQPPSPPSPPPPPVPPALSSAAYVPFTDALVDSSHLDLYDDAVFVDGSVALQSGGLGSAGIAVVRAPLSVADTCPGSGGFSLRFSLSIGASRFSLFRFFFHKSGMLPSQGRCPRRFTRSRTASRSASTMRASSTKPISASTNSRRYGPTRTARARCAPPTAAHGARVAISNRSSPLFSADGSNLTG